MAILRMGVKLSAKFSTGTEICAKEGGGEGGLCLT